MYFQYHMYVSKLAMNSRIYCVLFFVVMVVTSFSSSNCKSIENRGPDSGVDYVTEPRSHQSQNTPPSLNRTRSEGDVRPVKKEPKRVGGNGKKKVPKTWKTLVKKAKQASGKCDIEADENLHDFIDMVEKEEKVNLFELTFTLRNYSRDPFANSTGRFFKPWLWYTTRSRHGRTLLMLSFHYDVLSMNILTIGVRQQTVQLTDKPFGCFGKLKTDHQVRKMRSLLLGREDGGHRSSFASSNREEYACNQEIKNNDGAAEFVYNCCAKDANGDIQCSTTGNDLWIGILYFAICAVKIFMFLFCPKFLPQNVYSAAYAASEYVISLKKQLKMKIFISEKADANVRFKTRLTLEDISSWWRFRDTLDSLNCDEIIPLKMDELRIKVKGKRIIPENEPPTGLLRTIFDNLVRCKIKNLDPFKDCCESSIYAGMETKFKHNITWHTFVQILVKAIMLCLFPVPYYIRLIIYFKFEAPELYERREAIAREGLHEPFNLYRTNIIQYFSPYHGLFIATYIFYILCGVIIAFSDQAFREKLKGVARYALADMSAVSKSGVLGIIIRTLVAPFKRCGLLAFLVAPLYTLCVFPFCAVIFCVYCIPTVYLTFRLPFHAKKLSGNSLQLEEEKKKKFQRVQKLGRKISKIDKSAHVRDAVEEEESCLPSEIGFEGLSTIRSVFIKVVSSIFCLCILYSLALVFSESIGLFVEVMAFTMMGIIVNAGSVLKYVSMVLLVFVYMNDCYSNVYDNYLTFNKTVIDDMIDRTTADLRKIASMPSTMQANTAFVVKCVDEDKDNTPTLNFHKKEIRWRLGQLLLFLDSHDTPRIPLRLFQKLCQVRVHGAPGPVYINLLAATGKFMIIVVFLMFVMIVVMAFGNVYQMSSTNTTLATLAGGFVPMLLKNVLSSKGTKLSLKTISFKGQIDELIDDYKQFWPVLDLVVQRDIPEEPTDEAIDAGEAMDFDLTREDGRGIDKWDRGVNSKDGGHKTNSETGSKRQSVDQGSKKGDKLDDEKKNEKEAEGIIIENELFLENLNRDDDEHLVDLFIDLSAGDAEHCWSINGSEESINEEDHTSPPSYLEELKAINNNASSNYRYYPSS